MNFFEAIALADEQPGEYNDLMDLFVEMQGDGSDLVGLDGQAPAPPPQQHAQPQPHTSAGWAPQPQQQQWLPPQQQQQQQQQQQHSQSAWMQQPQQHVTYQPDQYQQQQQQQVSALLAAAQQQMNDATPGGQAASVLLQDAVNAASAHLSAWPMPAFGSAYQAAAKGPRGAHAGVVQPGMQQQGGAAAYGADAAPAAGHVRFAEMQQQPLQQQQPQPQQQQQRRLPKPQLSAATLAKAAVLAMQPADTAVQQALGAHHASPAGASEVLRKVASSATAPTLTLGPGSAAALASPSGLLPPLGGGAAVALGGAGSASDLPRTQLLNWMMGLQQLGAQQQQQQPGRPKKKTPAGLKDKVIALEAQLAEKQQQLEAAELEHMALTAKHRALEQMVKSAGDDVNIMTDMLASLSVSSDTGKSTTQAKAAAEAAVAALQGQGGSGGGLQQPNLSPQQQQQQQQQQRATAAPAMMASQQQHQQQHQHQQQRNTLMLRELMDTPLESLECILQAPAAAGGGGEGGGGGGSAAPSGAQQPTQQQQLRQPALYNLPSLEPFWKHIKATAVVDEDAELSCEGDDDEDEQQLLRDVYNSFSGSQETSRVTAASSGPGSTTTSMTDGGVLSGSGGGASGGGAGAAGGEVSSLPGPGGSNPNATAAAAPHAASAAAVTAACAAAAGYGAGGLLPSGKAEQTEEMAGAASLVYPSGLLMRPPKQLEEKLPGIQALHKRLVLQLMPLLLQVQQERLQMQATVQMEAEQQQEQEQGSGDAEEQHSGETAGARYEGQLRQTPAMQELTRVMLGYSKDIHEFAISNRMSTYELYTLNIETGVLGQPPPAGHWRRVAAALKDRLSTQAVADLCVARQLYSSSVSRIKHGRQLLVLQLGRLLDQWSSRPLEALLATDAVHSAVDGPHGEGAALLDAIDSNLRREYACEGVYQWMTHAILPMHVLAELVVHSYPYKADIHMTLQELMRDHPMPELTAVQKLQLRQLQEQNQQLALQQRQAQRQQLAVLLAKQQEEQQAAAAAALQALQQQRAMLALGQPLSVVSGSLGSFSSLQGAGPGSFSSLGGGSFSGSLAGGSFTAAPRAGSFTAPRAGAGAAAAAGGAVPPLMGGLMPPGGFPPLNSSGWPPV